MRILMANYRYFVSSGPERYLFNVTRRLEALGHEVMPLSVRYSQNEPSAYDRYFVSPIGAEDEVFFHQHRKSPATAMKGLSRLFYSREVEAAASRMVEETRPDVAYVLYYLRKMSPSLLMGIAKHKVPIVVRISDYGMMCGEHHMLLDDAPCTRCLDQGISAQVRNRCIKGSLALSALDAAATTFHRWRGYFDRIDRFVTTNEFMSEMMVRAGFDPARIVCIPTFTDNDRFRPAAPDTPPYLVYVGRLDRPKGVHVLIEAMAALRDAGTPKVVLKIAGSGHDEAYVAALYGRVAALGLQDWVDFLGAVPADQVPSLFAHALAAVMPVLWYENLPNSVVEAFASGCPVVASAIGSLAYTVTDGVDGLHAAPGDAADLARKLQTIIGDRALRDRLAANARLTAETKHSPDGHVARLVDLFEQLAPGGAPGAGARVAPVQMKEAR